jgi:ribA/ribD-fused uncharacterized protein
MPESYQSLGPWDRPGTLRFYGGPFSQFAVVPGLRLPVSYEGHPPGEWCEPATAEHYFNASKATNAEHFWWVLNANGPRQAKRRGGPEGERQPDGSIRRITLRAGWDDGIKQQVALVANRVKFALEPFGTLLLCTGEATLVEWSPTDTIWGGRAADGSATGQNLLGITLMRVRAERRAQTEARAVAMGMRRPFWTAAA